MTPQETAKYASLQLAAEAFLVDGSGNPLPDDAIVPALKKGNLHASTFSTLAATEFAGKWQVVAQEPNTKTGFSGTLFKSRETGEYVLSFRSTEFIEDAARDNQATNVQEINAHGFAFGQIRDMEAWFETLKAGELANKNVSMIGRLQDFLVARTRAH